MDVPFELMLIEECQPFLDEFKSIYNSGTKLPLRRGMVFQPDDHITKIKVNKERTPTNTNMRVHHASDQWFKERFGVKARSQSFFCTASKKASRDYGFPFLVFPVGQFEVIWSRKVDDLYFHMTERKLIERATGESVDAATAKDMINDPSKISDKLLYEAVSGMLDGFDYVKGSLDQALASKNEIMVLCDYYYVAKDDDSAVIEFIGQYVKGLL